MARSQKGQLSTGGSQSFSVAYTSFTLLLLGFFVLLDAIAVPNTIRRSRVFESLAEQFEAGQQATLDIADVAQQAQFEVRRERDRFVITIPGAELFASGDDTVKTDVIPVLDALAKQIGEFELDVSIEGHTDNQPIQTARFPSNWALSVARATSVLRLFLELGIPADRLSAAGRGEFQPVDSNDTPEGRARNRRVVLIVSSEQRGQQ